MPRRVFDRFNSFGGTCCTLINLTSCSTPFLPTDKLAPLMPTGYAGSPKVPLPISIIMYHCPRPFNSSTLKMEAFVFSEIYLSKYQKTHSKRRHIFLEVLICDFNIGTDLNVFMHFQRSGDQASRYSEPYKKERLASSFWRRSLRAIDWYNNRHCYNIPLSSGNGFAAVHMSSRVGTHMVESKKSMKLETLLEDKLQSDSKLKYKALNYKINTQKFHILLYILLALLNV